MHRGCSCLRQPLSQLRCQLPQRGSLLALHYPKAFPACGESGTKCRKGCGSEVAASATSSRRGCIEVALVYANPSVSYADSSPSGEPFGYRPPRMHAPDIPQIIAYMLKLTSISCFSIVMPIYIDNLMIMGYLITIRRGLRMKEINSFG